MPLESQETVWAALGVSGAHRVGACQALVGAVSLLIIFAYIYIYNHIHKIINVFRMAFNIIFVPRVIKIFLRLKCLLHHAGALF